ncbi:inosine triphosphate pyrophosphatase-like protein [Melampsora americana]|nr:inosine triphosphate pyrophosphatase-like protein [Melampsora americana]
MSNGKKLVFVTGNKNKLKEVEKILNDESLNQTKIEITSMDLDVPEVQGSTQDVAREKVKAASLILNGPCITEDTALCFKAMGGLPGPYIKWFLKSLGLEGLVKMISGFESKEAIAICTFAYCEGRGKEVILFEGITEGQIVSPRGPIDFGWDPIFEVNGTGLTYAEMGLDQKNTLSHRSKALQKLSEYFTHH